MQVPKTHHANIHGEAVLAIVGLIAVLACSPDAPLRPQIDPTLRAAVLDAPGILQRAEAGTLGRGEQDLLVRFERNLPGFGGLYLANGAVRVYMKDNSIPLAAIRAELARVYAGHGNQRVRLLMAAAVSNATVIRGNYSLTELIAIQKRVEARVVGWNAVGTNISENKVVVAFPDSQAMAEGLNAMQAAGVPTDVLAATIMPRVVATTAYFSSSYSRPTRAGLTIQFQNDTYRPHTYDLIKGFWVPHWYFVQCTLGYNVNTSGGDFFMTSSHCANTWRGVNGIVGDSIFQSDRGTNLSTPPLNGFVGTIVWNIPWSEGTACPISDWRTNARYAYCTTADVVLGRYVSGQAGVYGERKVATSKYGGINGNRGSDEINSYYPINAVLSPEYVDSTLHHELAKSGSFTGTTSGPFAREWMDMADVSGSVCWAITNSTCEPRTMLWQNHTVFKADVAAGDSGGPVFTGNPNNGSPYAALGIVAAGGIPPGQLPDQPCPSCEVVFSRWDQIERRLQVGTINPQTVF